MKVIEILKLSRELLKFCCDAGIRLDDIRYIDLFNDYNRLLADGEKITYIVAALAEKYGVCERTVMTLSDDSKRTAIFLQRNEIAPE